MENDVDEAVGVVVDEDSPPLEGEDGLILVSDADSGIKRRPGRPLEENVSSKPRGVPRFPTPPARKFASESPAGKNRPNQALNWLNGLPLAFRNRCDFYVYRDFPVLITPPVDTTTGRPKWYKYIDIVSASDANPIREESDLLNRYGCGRYRLILNETDKAKGEESRNIFMITVTGLGSDYDRYPPNDQLIGDITKVDLDHPDNRSYVQYLKRSGKLPGDLDKEKQEQEMATATIMEKVMDQNKDLIDTVVRTAKERPVTVAPVSTAGPDVTAVLTMAGEVMKEASLNAIKNSNGMTMKDVIELMNQLRPEDRGGEEAKELRMMMLQMMQGQIDSQKAVIDKLTAQPVQNPNNATPSSPFAYFDEGLKAMEHMKNVTDKFAGGGGGAAEEAGMPKFMSWLQPLLTIGQGLVGSGVQAWALYQRQQQINNGVPVSPVPPVNVTGMPGAAASTVTPNPAPASTPTAVTGLPAPSAAAGPIDTDAAEMQEAIELFNAIQFPLLQHLKDPDNSGITGIDFADWLIGGFGVRKYGLLRKRGDMIVPALQSYDPIKPDIDALPQGRLERFVGEFLTVDVEKILTGEYDDEDEEDGEDEDEGGVIGKETDSGPLTPVA
jgi:hypothetical protein